VLEFSWEMDGFSLERRWLYWTAFRLEGVEVDSSNLLGLFRI